MKMIYTLEELQALSQEELQALAYFGNDLEYAYKDIYSFDIKDNTITMHNKITLKCPTSEVLNKHRANKLRFDMLQSTLAGINQNNASKENLREEVKNLVEEQVTVLKDTFNTAAANAQHTFRNVEINLNNVVSSIESDFKGIESKFNAKLKSIDTDQFGPKMKKVDKIIDAFKELLQD